MICLSDGHAERSEAEESSAGRAQTVFTRVCTFTKYLKGISDHLFSSSWAVHDQQRAKGLGSSVWSKFSVVGSFATSDRGCGVGSGYVLVASYAQPSY